MCGVPGGHLQQGDHVQVAQRRCCGDHLTHNLSGGVQRLHRVAWCIQQVQYHARMILSPLHNNQQGSSCP
jgi:hypothetical protein